MGFKLVVLFVFSVFLLSSGDTLKIASVNASSLVSILMVAVFLFNGLLGRRFVLKSHPLQLPLALLFSWALISLLITGIVPSNAIPSEAYSYAWTTGLNHPDFRGLSFLLRLILVIFAIEFIVSNVGTKKKYFTVVNVTIMLYFIVCLLGFLQVVMLKVFNVGFGNITVISETEGYFRIGGYVGEPQTFGLILLSGFFPVYALIKTGSDKSWFSKRFLRIILFLAVVDLLFTFSVSMMIAMLVAFLIVRRQFYRKKSLLIPLISISILFFLFYTAINVMVVTKLVSELSSVNARTLTLIIGYSMFADNPLSGVGIGQSPLLAEQVSGTINQDFWVLSFDKSRVPVLNSYIEWLAETGAVGLLILAWIAYRLYKLAKGGGCSGDCTFVRMGYGGSILALAIAANSSSGNFYTGGFALSLAMYVAGMKIFKAD